MRRYRLLASALLVICISPTSRADDLPRVSILSRDSSFIRVETEGFEAKPERALFYRVHFAGSILGDTEPLPDGPFEIPTQETGIYTLTVVSQKTADRGSDVKGKILWEQDLFALRYSERLDGRDLRERLAHRYAPVVLFHREEEFFPSSIQYILNEESPDPKLAEETVQVRTGKLTWTSMSYSDLSEFLSTHGETETLVDTPRLRKILKGKMGEMAVTRMRFRTGSPEGATLYYSILESPQEEKAYINYHFLYAYDPKTGTAGDPSRVGHVFDRESLTVILDTTSMQAEAVVFGAHLASQTMGFFTTEGERVFLWEGGRVRVPWQSVDRLADHPFAAVARGSHGIYPLTGLYAVLEAKVKVLKEAAGGNRVLVPRDTFQRLDDLKDSTAVEIAPYTLLDLGLDEATSLGWNRILVFSGSLVDVPGATDARFPPFTARETSPAAYGEEAAVWPVGDIPRSARDHQELLIELLGSP